MSYSEKSAWIMSVALGLSSAYYFATIISMYLTTGEWTPPTLPLLLVYSIILIVIAVVGHIIITIFAKKDVNAKLDERERGIIIRTGHASRYILTTCIILSFGLYLFTYNGDLFFYSVLGSLIIGQLSEYALQIIYYRKGF